MINIIRQEIDVEESLKQKLEFICSFCNTSFKILNGSIRKIDKTNIAYIEPHKLKINENTYLFFNECNEVFINTLEQSISITELENYTKTHKKALN